MGKNKIEKKKKNNNKRKMTINKFEPRIIFDRQQPFVVFDFKDKKKKLKVKKYDIYS